MPVGDSFNMSFQGTVCGVPFIFDLAYVETTTPTNTLVPAAEALVEAWFGDPTGSPWEAVRACVTTDLNIECVVTTSDQGDVSIFFPDTAVGTVAPPALPTTHAFQINTPPRFPIITGPPSKLGGWFFLPAVPVIFTQKSSYDVVGDAFLTALEDGILFTDVTAGGPAGGAFRLMPHFGWSEVAAPGPAAEERWASQPFHQLWPKRLQDRRTDTCQAFGAGLLPGGIVIPVPPVPP